MKDRDSDGQPKPREDGGMKGTEEKDKKTGLVIYERRRGHTDNEGTWTKSKRTKEDQKVAMDKIYSGLEDGGSVLLLQGEFTDPFPLALPHSLLFLHPLSPSLALPHTLAT